jgi:hypothetical protein
LNLGSQQHRTGPQAMKQQHPLGSVARQPRPSGPPAMHQHSSGPQNVQLNQATPQGVEHPLLSTPRRVAGGKETLGRQPSFLRITSP